MKRAERPGCEERVACPPQNARIALPAREFLEQCSFADAGFAAHERDTTSAV
jgi:hypothetical protein